MVVWFIKTKIWSISAVCPFVSMSTINHNSPRITGTLSVFLELTTEHFMYARIFKRRPWY